MTHFSDFALITLFVLGISQRKNFSLTKNALATHLQKDGLEKMEVNAHMPMTWKGTTNGYPTFF